MPDESSNEPEGHFKSKRNLFLPLLLLFFVILAGCIFKATTSETAGDQRDNKAVQVPKEGFTGKILSTPEGSLFDNYFKTETGEYGLEAVASPIIKKLNELKDKDLEVTLWGEIATDVNDYSGQQIIVSRLDVPSENFSLAWEIENNQDLGISFQYPQETKFEIVGNALIFDGWQIELLKNPKSLDFSDWLNSNFSVSIDKLCPLSTSTDIQIGIYPTLRASISEGAECEVLGTFAISPDKQKLLKLTLIGKPGKNYQEIIKTLRFTETLSPDEVDLNESRKNGTNGQDTKLANPASVFCEEQGGQLELRTDKKTKTEFGVCLFNDQSECEEWAFYRGECQKGDNK